MKNEGLLNDEMKRNVLKGFQKIVTDGGYESNNGDLKETN